MLKKTIKYTDYNGEERVEDFYFNLNKTELAELELSFPGGIANKINSIQQKKDVPEMARFFQLFIEKAYGEKSDDGKHFRKGSERFEEFKNTEAYNQLIIELMENPKSTLDFFVAIFPEDLRKDLNEKANDPEVQKLLKQNA